MFSSFHEVERRHRRSLTAALAVFGLAILGPLAADAAIDPYTITFRPIEWKQLPLKDGANEGIAKDLPKDNGYVSSADALLPFSVVFFDQVYTQASVATSGYVSFGRRSDALISTSPNYANARYNHEIPAEWKTPNRMLALWWGDIDCKSPATMRSQTLGEAPNRKYVIEWRGCQPYNSAGRRSGSINMQIWFTEGSSTIETRYGTHVEATGFGSPADRAMAVGMMTDIPSAPDVASTGFTTFPCSPLCGHGDWPENTAVIYSQEADLVMDAVSAPTLAFPGTPVSVSATLHNRGTRPAKNFTVRFYVSPSPTMGPDAVAIGEATGGSAHVGGKTTLASGESASFTLDGVLPLDLDPGTSYILAEADPVRAVTEIIRDDNVGASDPMEVGRGTPDLEVGEVKAAQQAAPGATLSVQWIAKNIGNANAVAIPYSIRISSSDGISLTSRELSVGRATVNAFAQASLLDVVQIPPDIHPGTYRIGVIVDPMDTVPEIQKMNNQGMSQPIVVVSTGLDILTLALPVAELGAPFCKRLEASGGNGTYDWSVATGSALPPGLTLEVQANFGFGGDSTSLCGRPRALGGFPFTLELRSAGDTKRQDYVLEVEEGMSTVEIATRELPVAFFNQAFETRISASGGAAPYAWSLRSGSLAPGLRLHADGRILGTAVASGSYLFTVQAEDAKGNLAQQNLNLVVAPPSGLSCVTKELLVPGVGLDFMGALQAAGGVEPYSWISRDTRRLSTGFGDEGERLGAVAPPGLVLANDGDITGRPTLAGRFLWTVELEDGRANRQLCILDVRISSDGQPMVTTSALAPAVVGSAYAASLDALGGRGPYSWSLAFGSRLPPGLVLSNEGRIDGTPAPTALGESGRREFSFIVEVRDATGERAVGPLTVSVYATAPVPSQTDSPAAETESGGCSAGRGDPAALIGMGLLLLTGAGLRRRVRLG